MIYGPYSTGWRSESDRRDYRRRARYARLGVVMTVIIGLLFWLPLL